MIKTIKNKKIGKRILALFLALLTVLSCFAMMPFNSFALDSGIKEWYDHHRFTVDGQDAFCINFGKASSGEFATNEASRN